MSVRSELSRGIFGNSEALPLRARFISNSTYYIAKTALGTWPLLGTPEMHRFRKWLQYLERTDFFAESPKVSSGNRYKAATSMVNFEPPPHDSFPKQTTGVLEYSEPILIESISIVISDGQRVDIGHLLRMRVDINKTGEFSGRYRYIARGSYVGGRRYSSVGIQTLSRASMVLLLGDVSNFSDIDIANAHPSCAAQIVRRYVSHVGTKSPFLEKYVDDRDEMLGAVSKYCTYIEGGCYLYRGDAKNLFHRLLNGWALGGWAAAMGVVMVPGDISPLARKFTAGFQRDADALICVVQGMRPDFAQVCVGNRRSRPYTTECRSVLSELGDMAIQSLEAEFGSGLVSLHCDGVICRQVGNLWDLIRADEMDFNLKYGFKVSVDVKPWETNVAGEQGREWISLIDVGGG